MIYTSRSAIQSYLTCNRKRYLQYHADNGTAVAGWEPRRMALPLATGIYTHLIPEALLNGETAEAAIVAAVAAYRAEAAVRGIDVEAGDQADVVEEQAALIEALGWLFVRCVLPKLDEEYDLSRALVEKELVAQLDDEVTLAARVDLAAPRKADGKWFLFNWKTTSEAGDRFYKGFETDMQLTTEALAVEQFTGEQVAGVNVIGLVKGQRVPVDERMVEVRGDKSKVKQYIQRSRLLYGYKQEQQVTGEILYDYDGTGKRGWNKFRTWRETFSQQASMRSLEYWINWLPEEEVNSLVAWVPPIIRTWDQRQHVVAQIVAMEKRIRGALVNIQQLTYGERYLDEFWPQDFHSCIWPSRCSCYDICHTGNVAENPGQSGLYMPRVANHPIEGGE